MVGEVLRGEIADGEARQNDLGAAGTALGELVVDNVPLGVNDALILGRILQPNLPNGSP